MTVGMMMMTVMMKIKVCMHLMRHVLSDFKVGRMTGLMMMSDVDSGDDDGEIFLIMMIITVTAKINIYIHLMKQALNGMNGSRVSGDDYDDSGDGDDVRRR